MLEKLRQSWGQGLADTACAVTQYGEQLLSGYLCSTIFMETQKATAEKKITRKGRKHLFWQGIEFIIK